MNENVRFIGERTSGQPMGEFKLLQISDCHLGSHPHESLLGVDTDNSLIDVLSYMRGQELPDLIVASGDISNDGGVLSYSRFVKIMDEFFPDTPLAWLPGNHDDVVNMLSVADHPIELAYSAGGWRHIFLNSRIPGEEGGRLGPNELERLESELSDNKHQPCTIFLHHQPVPVGCAWLDQYVVEDAHAFFEVLDRHPQVKAVAWGHVHQAFETERNGVKLYASPSTCVQFLPNSKKFQLDVRMPGFRIFRLKKDGRFASRVTRAQLKHFNIDMTATGY